MNKFVAKHKGQLPNKEQLKEKTGLEVMQAILSGEFSAPPISEVMDYSLHSIAKGEAEFRGAPSFAMTNPMGTTHGGWYGTLLDSAMACAVMASLPKGSSYTTLEYKVNLIKVIPEGMMVRCVGKVQHCGRSTAVAVGEIIGLDDGKIYATGNTTCIIFS